MGEVSLLERVAIRRRTEEESSFATRLDERLLLAVADATGELQVALYGLFAAVAHMIAAGRRLLDDKLRKKLGIDFLDPRGEEFPAVVEVEAFEIPGDRPCNHTYRVVRVREPRSDLDLGGKPRLPVLPGADGGVLPRLGCRKAREACGEIRHCRRDGYCSHVASFVFFLLCVHHPLCERTLWIAFCHGS